MPNKPFRLNVFWPNILDEMSSREAAKQGWYAALFAGGMTIIGVIAQYTEINSLIDVGIICLIGYGCLKMSRIAAISGLVYTLGNGVFKYITHSTFGLMPLLAIFFVNAVRGTFKFNKIIKRRKRI